MIVYQKNTSKQSFVESRLPVSRFVSIVLLILLIAATESAPLYAGAVRTSTADAVAVIHSNDGYVAAGVSLIPHSKSLNTVDAVLPGIVPLFRPNAAELLYCLSANVPHQQLLGSLLITQTASSFL